MGSSFDLAHVRQKMPPGYNTSEADVAIQIAPGYLRAPPCVRRDVSNPVSCDVEPSLCREKTDIENWRPETGAWN
jgi:hypothetical protein